MSVTLTENAAKRVHTFLASRTSIGLRLAVKTRLGIGQIFTGEDDLLLHDHGLSVALQKPL